MGGLHVLISDLVNLLYKRKSVSIDERIIGDVELQYQW